MKCDLLVVLICFSLVVRDIEHLYFQVPVGHLYVSFGKISAQVICSFFDEVICILAIEFLICSSYWPLIRYMVCKWCPPFGRWPLHFVDGFFGCAEILSPSVVSGLFAFIACASGVTYLRSHCQDQCQGAFPLGFPLGRLVSSPTFKSLVHFEFIFVNGIR